MVVTHQRELAKYAGQWLAVEGSKLIAYGASLKEVEDKALDMGVEHPFLAWVPQPPYEGAAEIL